MEEEMKKGIQQIRKLDTKEHQSTRRLYEEIFPEDSKSFVDYYYHYKIKENQIYITTVKEEMVAMLHLNPYLIKLGAGISRGHYIVAVATKEEYRHQGIMSNLIKRVLADGYRAEEPFTFLMPVAEAIYLPFDFRFIYEQPQWEIQGKEQRLDFECTPVSEDELELLSVWANQMLDDKYRTYAIHSKEYFENLIAEQAHQAGQVVVIKQNGSICGYFYTTTETGAEVREAVIERAYKESLEDLIADYLKGHEKIKVYGGMLFRAENKKKPQIMARIIHLERLIQTLTAQIPVCFNMEVIDTLIWQNNGIFRVQIDENGGKLQADESAKWTVSIAELTQLVFGMISIEETAAPKEIKEVWQQIQDLAPVMLNEVV